MAAPRKDNVKKLILNAAEALLEHKKISDISMAERTTEQVSPEYLSWLILLLSDGLFIHQTLDNSQLDVERFIEQTAGYVKGLLQFAVYYLLLQGQ